MNLLTYVHLRNIYRSTGVGRVGRELTEYLAQQPEIRQKILADRQDHAKIVHKVGAPWTGFDYCFFEKDTSRQQMLWYLLDRPKAESFWPEVDVVYCTAESYVPVKKARLAVANHDMQLFEPAAHPPSRWLTQQRFKWRLMFNRLRERAAMFHAISQFSAERLEHYFPGVASRIRVIPNAVSESFFQPPTEQGNQVLAKLQLVDVPYVLIPGGLHFRKNAELILQAWPTLHALRPDLRLVVMGHNNPAYLEQAKSLQPGLVFAGFCEDQELVALYYSAQAVWFPSRYEGFGMPVVEAMACGVPVVSTDASAIPEVTDGAAYALLAPDRPEQHVEALDALLGDSQGAKAAVERGKARAAQFRWQRSGELLAKALGDLA